MSTTLVISLRNLLDMFDGEGLTITDYDELSDAVFHLVDLEGCDIDTDLEITVYEPEL